MSSPSSNTSNDGREGRNVKQDAPPTEEGRHRRPLFDRFHSRFPHGSLRRSLASGAFWSLIGAVCSRGFTLVASILIARFLGKAGYGQWGIILVTVGMFAQYASFGASLTATKHVAELRKSDPGKAGRILSLVMLLGLMGVSTMALVCLGASRWLAYSLFQVPELFVPLMFAGIMLFCMVGTQMLQGALAGFEDFRRIARINLAQGIVLFIAAVPLTWRLGLVGTVIGMSISQAAALVLCLRAVLKKSRDHGMPISTKGVWQERRILWHYAAPSFLTGGITGPAWMLSKAIVARIPGGVVGLGGFQAAFRWRDIVLFVPGAVRRVTLPMLSGLKGANDRRRFIKALWANIAVNGGVAFIGAIPIMLLSPWILSLYGRDFRQDWDIMVILVGSGVFQAVKDVLSQVTASMGKMWWNFGMAIIWSAVTLGGTALMVPRYGVLGYVWVVAFASVINMIMYSIAATIAIRKSDSL